MATNNLNPTPQRQAQPAQSLLSGLAVKAEHMIVLGCGGLVLVIIICAMSIWFGIDSWTSGGGGDTTSSATQEWRQPMTIPDCGRGRVYVQTNRRGDVVGYQCGR